MIEEHSGHVMLAFVGLLVLCAAGGLFGPAWPYVLAAYASALAWPTARWYYELIRETLG